MDPEVLEVVISTMREDFGNPSSRTHVYGQRAKAIVERARDQVAAAIGCDPSEVFFTSGATESNNLAIRGLANLGRQTERTHIISTAIEHKSVLEPLDALHAEGFEVTLVSPDASGAVAASDILDAIRPNTLLVSVMGANNETGVIQNVGELGAELARSAIFLHVDAAQLFGKVPSQDLLANADLISLSGHKIGGPKGVGALICRRFKNGRVPISPIMVGGGQERGLRAGTLSAPLIAGFGVGMALAKSNINERFGACSRYRETVMNALNALGVTVNGDASRSLPNILSVAIPGIDAEAAIVAMKELAAVATGSACTSQHYTPSHVLTAMGLDQPSIESTIRLSWCHLTPPAPWEAISDRLLELREIKIS